jgi:putative acetyltransferase
LHNLLVILDFKATPYMDTPRTYTYRDIRAIRPEMPADFPAIHSLLEAAFGRSDEAELVQRLRLGAGYLPDLALCIWDWENVLVGHLFCSHCRIVDRDGHATPSLALAPLAVLPDHQGKGLGTGLVRNCILRAADLGFAALIVLGNPRYYGRFGFESAEDHAILAPFATTPGSLQVLQLHPGALAGVSGTVEYDPAFQL